MGSRQAGMVRDFPRVTFSNESRLREGKIDFDLQISKKKKKSLWKPNIWIVHLSGNIISRPSILQTIDGAWRETSRCPATNTLRQPTSGVFGYVSDFPNQHWLHFSQQDFPQKPKHSPFYLWKQNFQ